MPHIKKRQNTEEELRILRALDALHADPKLSIRAAGRKYGVPRTTLTNRFHGKTKSRHEAHQHQQLLTEEEEKAIVAWIGRLDDIGIPPRLAHLYEMARAIIQQRESSSQVFIGEHWVSRFLNRHPNIAFRLSARIDNERASANNPTAINHYFNRLSEVKSRFRITPDNTYNADEKGFAIGQAKQAKVFVRKQRRTSHIRQPGNREWVSVFECVSANGKVLPAFIIYKGESHLLGWHDYKERDEATFALSNNGWTDDDLGYLWLKMHFEPHTTTSDHRLLIIDGHSSHLTVEFIQYCLDHNIHLLCLPPHATHLLQPLDIGLFSPLKQYFSNLLDLWTRTHPYQQITKGDFFPLLMKARRSAYTEKNIKSAFAAAGIVPFRRHRVLEILQHPSVTASKSISTTNAKVPTSLTTPKNARDIQNMKLLVANSENLSEIKQMFDLLAYAAGTAFADLAIARETIRQLTTTQKKSQVDRRQISKARVITRRDLDRLRKLRLERDEKKKVAEAKQKIKFTLNSRGKKRSRNEHNLEDDSPSHVAKRQKSDSEVNKSTPLGRDISRSGFLNTSQGLRSIPSLSEK